MSLPFRNPSSCNNALLYQQIAQNQQPSLAFGEEYNNYKDLRDLLHQAAQKSSQK
jgi:hypothetical protein